MCNKIEMQYIDQVIFVFIFAGLIPIIEHAITFVSIVNKKLQGQANYQYAIINIQARTHARAIQFLDHLQIEATKLFLD